MGSPGTPQPATTKRMKNRKWKMGRRLARPGEVRSADFLLSIFDLLHLQNVTAQILILNDVGELFVDVSGVDLYALLF